MKKYLQYMALCVMCYMAAPVGSQAQCVMCRSSVDSHAQHEKDAKPMVFNGAILYLLAVPYLSAALIAYLWYKKAKKRRRQESMTLRIGDKKMSI